MDLYIVCTGGHSNLTAHVRYKTFQMRYYCLEKNPIYFSQLLWWSDFYFLIKCESVFFIGNQTISIVEGGKLGISSYCLIAGDKSHVHLKKSNKVVKTNII
jgi:hypothetical protein